MVEKKIVKHTIYKRHINKKKGLEKNYFIKQIAIVSRSVVVPLYVSDYFFQTETETMLRLYFFLQVFRFLSFRLSQIRQIISQNHF